MQTTSQSLRTLAATALTAGLLVVGGAGAAIAAPADLDVRPRGECPWSDEERAERHEARRAERADRQAERQAGRDERREACEDAETCPMTDEERAERWEQRDERRAERAEGRTEHRRGGHSPAGTARGKARVGS